MNRAAVFTLGCKVNQVESEAIIEELKRHGYTLVQDSSAADLCIINTCSVTATSDRKSRNLIRRIARANPGARLVVTGCLAELRPEEIAAIDGVDMVLSNRAKDQLVQSLDTEPFLLTGHARVISPEPGAAGPLKKILYDNPHRRTRAFIKIADGCESFCTYCIVPYARGPVRSKLPADVVDEIRQLVKIGYREIVLTGINIGLYGRDLPERTSLYGLLKQILQEVPGNFRLRMGSVNPLEITPELIGLMAAEPRLCRHLHIPLQSGCDRILELMGRGYTGGFYQELLLELAARIPGIGLTTDVMVGFPGESNADFETTYSLLEYLPLLNMHVFRYSVRPGTPAATFDEQVSDDVKESRSRRLLSLSLAQKQKFLEKMQGQKWPVLVEQQCGNGIYKALSDNYVELLVQAGQDINGSLMDVWITRRQGSENLWGEIRPAE